MIAMSLLPAAEWLEATFVAQTVRHSAPLIALLEIVHLIGLSLLLGTILMVDLSLLGRGIGQTTASRMDRELRNWTAAGLILMLTSGPVLLSSEAVRCFKTPAFWTKMALLAVALTFHFTKHRSVVSQDPPAPQSDRTWTAWLSLTFWISVALAGKAIAIFSGA
jgi:hypothetical protein